MNDTREIVKAIDGVIGEMKKIRQELYEARKLMRQDRSRNCVRICSEPEEESDELEEE